MVNQNVISFSDVSVSKAVNYHNLIPMQNKYNDHDIFCYLLSLSELLFSLYTIVEPWY